MKEAQLQQGAVAQEIRVVKQQSPKEIQADHLARTVLELEQLECRKKNFEAEYKKDKLKLETDVKTFSAIIRNYGKLFENVDTGSGEITEEEREGAT